MAITVEQIRRVVTQYESRGADKAAADLNAVSNAQGNVARTGATMATVTDTVTKRQLDAGRAADTVRRKYDEEFRTLQTLAREHQRLDRALQTGRITAEDYSRTLDLMHAKLGVVSQAQAEVARRVQQETRAIEEAAAAQQRYAALLGVRDDFGTDARAADIAAFAQEYDRYIAKLVAAKNAEQELARVRAASAQTSINERLGVRDDFGTEARAADIAAFAREYEHYVTTLVAARKAEDDLARSRAANAQTSINQRLGVRDDFGSTARAADIAAVGDEIQRLREKYVPLAALQRQYRQTLEEINQAAKVGILTEAQRADAVSRTKTVFAEQVVAMRGVQEATGRVRLAGHDLANLSYQLNDVFTMMAMGAPPMQIVASQLGQIYQILAGQQGGVVGGFKALGGSLAGLVTPTGVAVTALAAVGVTAVAAYGSWVASEKQLQAALQGRGRATGATAQELMALAAAASEASGITQGAARDIAASLASTGQISTAFYVDLIAAAESYASVVGGDVSQAGKDLAEAFAEPGKGAEDLNRKLNFLDDTTLQYVKSLDAANKTTQAQAILLDRLNAVLPNAETRLTALGRAWRALSGAISGAFAEAGRVINDSLEIPLTQRRIAELQQSLQDLPDLGALTDWKRAEIQAEIDLISDQIELQRRQSALSNNEAEKNRISTAGGDALRSWDSRYGDLSRLQSQQADLQRALDAGVGDADAQRAALEGITNQIRSMTDAYGNLIPQAEAVRREQELQNALATATTPAQRAAASAALERFRAEAEGADNATASAKANAAAQQEMLQAQVGLSQATRDRLLSAQESIAAQQLEMELIGKTAGEAAELRANYQAYWDLKREATANGTQVDERQLEVLKQQNAILGEIVQKTAERNLLADVQFEREQLGRNSYDQEIASTLRSAGLEVDLDGFIAQQLRMNQQLKITRDLAGDALSGFVTDILDGKDAMEALENAAKRALNVILDIAMQNLASSLFGPSTGGGGILGGIVSAVMGIGSPAGASSGFAAASGQVYAQGGLISGPGTGTSDSIVARVSDGEFVVNAAATRRNLPLLTSINDNSFPGFATGGVVSRSALAAVRQSAAEPAASPGRDMAPMTIIYNAPSVSIGAGVSLAEIAALRRELAEDRRNFEQRTIRTIQSARLHGVRI